MSLSWFPFSVKKRNPWSSVDTDLWRILRPLQYEYNPRKCHHLFHFITIRKFVGRDYHSAFVSLFHLFSYLTRLYGFYVSCSMMLMIIDVNSFLWSPGTVWHWTMMNVPLKLSVLPYVQREEIAPWRHMLFLKDLNTGVTHVSNWWVKSHNWTIHFWKCRYLKASSGPWSVNLFQTT